ncbi:MAG: 5'/3'-nucleotidase SurE [Rhodospirillaceae bacterium]
MFKPIPDLSKARILVSNDDGIHGPGLEVLERVAASLSDDVWVAVPETEQSGAGHSLTLHHPLRIREVEPRRFAIAGTPTDSVLLAVNHILTDRKPDLVLSGINRGANLGEDVHYSGTVAAAMEGTLLGLPSIAMSQVFTSPDPIKWETAERYAAGIIAKLMSQEWPGNVLMNINFPDAAPDAVAGVEMTRQGRRKIGDGLIERHDPRGHPYIWIGPQRSGGAAPEGTDIEAVGRGAVSITPLKVDLTDTATLQRLKEAIFP